MSKKKRMVRDEICIEGMSLVEIIEAVHARGGTMKHAVFDTTWRDYDDARATVRFERPETKAERKARKNPKTPQTLVFESSDPIASLGSTSPAAPGYTVSDTMPRGVPDGTIWINTGPDLPPEDIHVEAPPSTKPHRWVWWPAAVIALLAILYVVFLLVMAVRHS